MANEEICERFVTAPVRAAGTLPAPAGRTGGPRYRFDNGGRACDSRPSSRHSPETMKHLLPSRLAILFFLSMTASSCVRQQTAKDLPDTDLTKTGGLFAGVQRPPTEEELQAPLLLIGGRTVTYGDLVAESQRVAQAAGIPRTASRNSRSEWSTRRAKTWSCAICC